MNFKFGISMRVTNAKNYDEPRDTISRDWSNYMIQAFPKSKWMFIPNINENVIDFIQKWNLNVIILSGGDDIGLYPKRDNTELLLLEYALNNNIPIIGICRGLQLIHHYFGGKLINGDDNFTKVHRAKNHTIEIKNSIKKINSFHSNKIDEESLHKSFRILARSMDDKSIEAITNENIIAFMWHPERDNIVSKWNLKLINQFLKKWKTEQ